MDKINSDVLHNGYPDYHEYFFALSALIIMVTIGIVCFVFVLKIEKHLTLSA